MGRVLGPAVGSFIRRLNEVHSVTFHLDTTATAIDERCVTLATVEHLDPDLVSLESAHGRQ